jgi:hypothetical protein
MIETYKPGANHFDYPQTDVLIYGGESHLDPVSRFMAFNRWLYGAVSQRLNVIFYVSPILTFHLLTSAKSRCELQFR